MKIIREGYTVDHVFYGTCGACDCEIEAIKGELKIVKDAISPSRRYKVDCPCCHADIQMTPSEIKPKLTVPF